MAEGLLKSVEADISSIPISEVKGNDERDRVMKLFAHSFLRLWTRLALESGQRLKLSPSPFVLGSYEGHMRWTLNEAVDYKGIAHLELGGTFRKKHALIGETYVVKGEEKARVFFALEEERVKDRPVYVNYLVYDSLLGGFDLGELVHGLSPVLQGWLETITTGDETPLWNACENQLECVGI